MNILQTIVEQKQREIALLPVGRVSVADLRLAINQRGGLRDFRGALEHPRSGNIALIAEVKKASPSAGIICPDFDAVRIARRYEEAGVPSYLCYQSQGFGIPCPKGCNHNWTELMHWPKFCIFSGFADLCFQFCGPRRFR